MDFRPRVISRLDVVEESPRYIEVLSGFLRLYTAHGLVHIPPTPPKMARRPTLWAEDLVPELKGHVIVGENNARHVLVHVDCLTDFAPALHRLNRLGERHGGFFERTDFTLKLTQAVYDTGVIPLHLT